MPNEITDKVAWLPFWNEEVLFARSRKNGEVLICVGGKIEKGEGHIGALIREVKEETGLDLDIPSISFVKKIKGFTVNTKKPLVLYCYAAESIQPLSQAKPCNEIVGLEWITSKDKKRTSPVGRQLLKWLVNKKLIK